MSENKEPSYETLKRRLETAETALDAVRKGQVDAIMGDRETLVIRLKETEARETHIKQVLLAIRNVNQLIVKETDPQRLIDNACANLTETLGYHNAWIALLNEDSLVVRTAASGFDGGFEVLEDRLQAGDFPTCMQQPLAQETLVVVEDPASECRDCPLAREYEGRAGLTRCLSHGGRTYGVLSVSVPAAFAYDTEEQDLFKELADDLGFALYKIAAEESLRLHSMTLNQIKDRVTVTDLEGYIIYVNEAACRMLGKTKEELLSRHVSVFGENTSTGPSQEEIVQKTLQDGLWRGEVTNYRADGSAAILDCRVQVVRDETGKPVALCGISTDITDRKQAEERHVQLEEQMRQAQKLESIGLLAGGVAHDFNNMLGIIIANAELAEMRSGADGSVRQNLQEILKASHRAADTVRQLLAFARKQTINPKDLDLNETVSGILKMLRRIIGENIDLRFVPGKGLWNVRMDPAQVHQLLTNLVVNSRDALPDGGRITIETDNKDMDEFYAQTHNGFVPGKYVLLMVSDTGEGMSPEVMDHLFDPFFTTKEVGWGTGLGLATVYGMVKQNHGFIYVYSEPGQGTTVKIYLPRHEGKRAEMSAAVVKKEVPGGNETVLVAEDEEVLLQTCKHVLERQGYTVLAARKPGEALALAEQHPGEIHMLLTDVVMPEMNGRELAERLQALRPTTKCLFMSGYTADVVARHGVLDRGVEFIEKPFSFTGLAEKVRGVLDKDIAE